MNTYRKSLRGAGFHDFALNFIRPTALFICSKQMKSTSLGFGEVNDY